VRVELRWGKRISRGTTESLVLVLIVIPYYMHLRWLISTHARIPCALGSGRRWRCGELDRAVRVILRRRRRRVGRGVERDEEHYVRVQQECHALCMRKKEKTRNKEELCQTEAWTWRDGVLFGRGKHDTYLKMMRTYVTWSMPPPCTNCSCSSVADMNSKPAATKSLCKR
jgi:hypothetical protein